MRKVVQRHEEYRETEQSRASGLLIGAKRRCAAGGSPREDGGSAAEAPRDGGGNARAPRRPERPKRESVATHALVVKTEAAKSIKVKGTVCDEPGLASAELK